jgi:AraC-like DNA-binding protein
MESVTPPHLVVADGLGVSARVRQFSPLEWNRLTVDLPTVILVIHGTKRLRWSGGELTLNSGDAVALEPHKTLEFTDILEGPGPFEARWICWEPELFSGLSSGGLPKVEPFDHATKVPAWGPEFRASLLRAQEALEFRARLPDDVVRHRLQEPLVWLAGKGIRFRLDGTMALSDRVRKLIARALDRPWTTENFARDLAMSEATMRRRLAAEGTNLSEILTATRMSQALTLLQCTDEPVASLCQRVGYESPSRFAHRFRQHYGFAPTAVRGHDRP